MPEPDCGGGKGRGCIGGGWGDWKGGGGRSCNGIVCSTCNGVKREGGDWFNTLLFSPPLHFAKKKKKPAAGCSGRKVGRGGGGALARACRNG